MSTQTQTIRVRILPGVRMWQVVAIAAAIVVSLMLGVLVGRSDAPAGAATMQPRDFSRYACTGHVPNAACRRSTSGTSTRATSRPVGSPSATNG